MICYLVEYPGDPPCHVIEMTREEFQDRYRPAQWTLNDGVEIITIPVSVEEIYCDTCNADPGETIFVHLYGNGGCRAICRRCFEEFLKKYVTGQRIVTNEE